MSDFSTVRAVMKSRYRIGHAPRQLEDTLKEMGAKRNRRGWYHNDESVAEEARQMILDEETRHYFICDDLDDRCHPERFGCRYDDLSGKWYALNEEVAVRAQFAMARQAGRQIVSFQDIHQ